MQLISIRVGTHELSLTQENAGLPYDKAVLIRFNTSLDKSTVEENVSLLDQDENLVNLSISYLDNDQTISARPNQNLEEDTEYQIIIGDGITGIEGKIFPGIAVKFKTLKSPLSIHKIEIDDSEIDVAERILNISFNPKIKVFFSEPISGESVSPFSSFKLGVFTYNFSTEQVNDSTILFSVTDDLPYYRKISFLISALLSDEIGREFNGLILEFYTKLDTNPKFPLISDDELLTLIQRQTFKYFWDFGHPVSGLSRERITSDETVTIGGSGFGVMTFIVGVERGFITRLQAVSRWRKIINFLKTADRFHGVWPHWMNGSTGKTIPFSSNDDGGDIVETSYMIHGLLTVRQYLDPNVMEEMELINDINQLWEDVEWDWYTQGENSITWHWSPNYGFEKNLKVRGWNEALIVYILAASSPTHSVEPVVYHEGWAKNGDIINGNSYYNIPLPLGRDYGGPLFFEHYSFLGLDPRNLVDQYADYWDQARAHTSINRAYCVDNPLQWIDYSEDCWGLTASDGNRGYSAHSPTNDRGVITPTAAISSLPFTPEESMKAIRHFYFTLGDRIWGDYGFYDAFNFTENWVASSFLAIDQGPIIVMIENHRTALFWDLFMTCPEIQQGLDELGFTY